MNDEIFNPIGPIEFAEDAPERYAEAPRPDLPKRTIVRFKIIDERDNSQS